jgi:hypothetical protein
VPDHHFSVDALEKLKQLVGREAAEMPVHQVRYIGLGNSENTGDLALLQLFIPKDSENIEAELHACKELVRLFQTGIGKDVPGAFLKLNALSFFVFMLQLLCFPISLPDQINVPFRGLDGFLRFLLKGVQYINTATHLDGHTAAPIRCHPREKPTDRKGLSGMATVYDVSLQRSMGGNQVIAPPG